MGNVLGFTGRIGSGKTAAAQSLHEVVGSGKGAHIEFSDPILRLADEWMVRLGETAEVDESGIDALRAITADQYGIRVGIEQSRKLEVAKLGGYLALRQSMPDALRPVTVPNKEHHRPLLQWLGRQMMVHVDGRFWSRMVESSVLKEQAAGRELVTVGGVRHLDDAVTIHAMQGRVIEAIRPGAASEHQSHDSEANVPQPQVDVRIFNEAGLSELQGKMEQLWDDLQADSLAHSY